MLRTQQVAAALSFLLVVASGSAAADSGATFFATPMQDPTSQGFIVPLPEIDPADLAADLRETRTDLEARRLHYREVAEDTQMTAGKFILALIAPGGFLFAAGSEIAHTQAENKVESLAEEIQALGEDLEMFEGIALDRRIILARYP